MPPDRFPLFGSLRTSARPRPASGGRAPWSMLIGCAAFLLLAGVSGCRRSGVPHSRIERLALARNCTRSGDVGRALELYKSLIEDDRPDRSRIALEAALFCRSRRMTDGVLYYTDFVAMDAPERRTADELLVEALLDKKDLTRLGTFLESRWKAPDTRAWAGPYLAELKVGAGDRKGALAVYDALLREFPEREEEWRLAKARLLLAGRGPDAAGEEFRAILAKNPRSVAAHLGLAALAVENRDWNAVERNFRRALEADPRSADALLGLAFAAAARGKPAEAEKLYARTLSLPRPPFIKLYSYLDLLFRRRDADRLEQLARAHRPSAAALPAETAFGHCAAGLAALLGDDRGSALTQLTAAAKADPGRVDPRVVLVRLARLELDAGHSARARKWIEKARRRGPLGRDGALVSADLALEARDYPTAVKWARTVGSGDPRAARILAQCDAAMARLQEARRYLHPFKRSDLETGGTFDSGDALLAADALEAGGAAEKAAALLGKLAGGKADAAARLLARAKLAWVRGDRKQAATLLVDLERAAPDGAARNAVRLLRLRLALVMRDKKEAAALLDGLVAEKTPDLDLYQGWLAVLQRRWDRARAHLAKSKTKYGWDAVARFTLEALCALKAGKVGEAAARFDQAAGAVARPAPSLLALSRDLYAQAGKYDLAANRGRAYVHTAPADVAGWLRLSRLLELAGRADERVEAMREARRRFPKDAGVAAELCRALLATGRSAETVEQARKLLTEFPDAPGIRLTLAEAFLARRDTTALERTLATFRPGAPGSREAGLIRVMERTLAGKYTEALELLDSLPDSGSGYRPVLLRALLFSRTGKTQKAEELCIGLTAEYPDGADAFFLLGELYVRRDRRDLAIGAFRKCVELNENSVPALNNLAWLLMQEHRNLPEAVSCIRRARRLAPESGEVLDTLAAVELAAGNHQAALDAALAATGKRPGFWPWYHAAVAASRLRDPRKIEYFEKARGLAKSPEERKLVADFPGRDP